MRLVTWNVQWFRGLDGRVDPARVIAHALAYGNVDVLCLQEIADHFPAPHLAGNDDDDQFARVASLLPGYAVASGIGADLPGDGGRRRRFGNLVASRLPMGQVFRHALPWPADGSVPSMPRVAVEAVVAAPFGELRVITTHLEYYSKRQRTAQVARLRAIHAEGHGQARAPARSRDDDGPFRVLPRPFATIVCGDFNLPAGDEDWQAMQAPFDDGTSRLNDAWRLVHGDAPQPPTFCVHEAFAPGSKPVACDFVFASDEIAGRVRRIEIDGHARLSDHQPVVVDFAD
jgi:endonuclease/exonuclease/phosphatase family metal-dependent hydrolase